MIEAFHHPGQAAPIGDHTMPMEKFQLVADRVAQMEGVRLLRPEPVIRTDLLRVHTDNYIAAIETGKPRPLAESQKFPWVPGLYESVRLTNGAVAAAAQSALAHGIAAAVASGFHHACADHGEGFCTFNGLIVALEKLYRAGKLRTAAVLDLDLHYGNGTAQLIADRPWIRQLSIYGNDFWNNVCFRDVTKKQHSDGTNHLSFALPAQSDGPHLLEVLEQNLPWLLQPFPPDLILFQAGADPLRDDPYSPLNLGAKDLEARDRHVFSFFRRHGIPLAWTLAGGYTKPVEKVVAVHVGTFKAALDIHGR
jgi:acetoin utilization deacetylase AcuC-like enzyme